jgi:hypothetical protein
MGKKRRMLSATKKFAQKHKNHPRMRAIGTIPTTAPITATTPVAPPKSEPIIDSAAGIKVAEIEVAPPAPADITTDTTAPTPRIQAKTTKKKAAPKTTKKTTTRRRKTTKKKSNTATT